MNFEQLAEEVKCFDSCELKNLPFSAVEHLQIIAALNKNLGVDFATGTLYHLQRETANEARTKNKLVNPVEGSTYSDALERWRHEAEARVLGIRQGHSVPPLPHAAREPHRSPV